MEVRELTGVLMGFLVLAGLSMAIINGGKTASIFTAFANGFATDIKASTLQGATLPQGS